MRLCWRHPLVALVAISCFNVVATASPTKGAEDINGIAAVVNDDVITYGEVRDLSEPQERLLHSQFSGEELEKKVGDARKAALQDLIDRQLIIQAFEKEKLEFPDFLVDERVDAVIRDAFGGDRQAFIKTLESQHYTLTKFRDAERDKIKIQAMRQRAMKTKLIVPPAQIDEYYQKHKDLYSSKAQVKLRMIMIPGKGDAKGNDPQKSMAEEIRTKILAGADFDKMAQMYSEDSTRDLGGDWGWVDDKTLSQPLSEVAFRLKPGDVSKIVAIGGNYYILKVEGRQGGDVKPLASVRADIEKQLRQQKAQELQEHWIASLRSKAFIKTF